MIGVEELVDEVFEGSCILKIYHSYVGSCKSISLSVEEIKKLERLELLNVTLQMRAMKVMRRVMRKPYKL